MWLSSHMPTHKNGLRGRSEIVDVNAVLRRRDVPRRKPHRFGVEWILDRMSKSFLGTASRVGRGKNLTTESGFNSRSFAPARAKGAAQRVSGGTPNSLRSPLPRKSASASATLALAPQSRQRRLGGVMATPQLTFSDPALSQNREDSKREGPTSTYCGECLCGMHFEIRSLEWICPDCHRQIVIEWPA
jgi:hypothetical protein